MLCERAQNKEDRSLLGCGFVGARWVRPILGDDNPLTLDRAGPGCTYLRSSFVGSCWWGGWV